MIEKNESSFFIRDIELAVLLAAKGKRDFFGFKVDGIEELDTGALHQMLFSLAKKGFIIANETKFEIIPTLDKMLNTICNAKKIIFTSSVENSIPEQSIYIADRAVIIQACGSNGDMFRIVDTTKENYPKLLTEQGIRLDSFIESGKAGLVELTAIPERLEGILEDIYEDDSINLAEIKGQFKLDIIDADTESREKLIILLTYEANDYICVCSEKKTSVYEYSDNNLESILKES